MKNFIIFALGFVTGAAVVWNYRSIEEKTDENVSEPSTEEVKPENTEENKEESKETVEAEKIIESNGYRDYSKSSKKAEEKTVDTERPYVIPPDEFDELDEYEATTLIYYQGDQTLTCDDEVINNVDEVVGRDSLKHFGEYEEDSVYVRNDRLKCDYEILLDRSTYRELLKDKPYLRGGANDR